MVDVSGIGTQGYSSPYNPQYQLTADGQQLTPYDNLTIWQVVTQENAIEDALQSMEQGLFDDEDQALEDAIEKAEGFSINEEGKTYNEQIDALTQSHINAYDSTEAPDGKISYDEFVMEEVLEYNAFYGEALGELTIEDAYSTPQFAGTFNFMDLNGDNAIDANEVKAYYLMVDMYDAAANPPENPDEILDGVMKFSSFSKINDIMANPAEEGTEAAETRAQLRAAMVETYNSFAAEPITLDQTPTDPVDPQIQPASIQNLECGEPTALGKTIMEIEKNIFNNPFEL